MAEPATSDSSPDTDREFEPSADMLVHEFDDEQTLDEEEAMSGESCANELEDLEKEGDMPIEDLLAMYGYNSTGPPPAPPTEPQDTRSSSEEEILSNQDLTLDKDEIARDLLKEDDEDNNKETSVNDLLVCVKELPSQTSRLLRSNSQAGSSEEEDSEDEDYQPVKDDDWKKMISVGSDFQACVPDGLSKYGDAPAYENEDRLLWDPNKMDDSTVEKYLDDVHKQNQQCLQGVQAIPTSSHTRDDEQALYLLLQCGHNVEEALRRRKMQAVPPTDPMSLWSEEECRNFENGLRSYGKDFYLIQQNKVRTRSVGELVQFYYLWKKTERHDVFANKTRLEKKKYALHPGVTDYMDRFLDEQENPAPVRERSASPNITSLIYGDPKRQHIELEAALEMVQKVVGNNSAVFSPLKLHPDLQPSTTDVCVQPTTTVSIDHDAREGQQSTENLVHIANFTSSLPLNADDQLANGLIEPSPKRMKLDTDVSMDSMAQLQQQLPSQTVEESQPVLEPVAPSTITPLPDTTTALPKALELSNPSTTTDIPSTEPAPSSNPDPTPAPSSPPSTSTTNTNSTDSDNLVSSSQVVSTSSPPVAPAPQVKTVSETSATPTSSVSAAENGTHMNNVEVSISSVSNSVHNLVDGALSATASVTCPTLSADSLPARPTEPVAQ